MQRKNIRKEKAREFLTTALYSNSNKKNCCIYLLLTG